MEMRGCVTAALFLLAAIAVHLSTVDSRPSANICDPHCKPLPNACKKQGPGKCDHSKGCIDGWELTEEFTCRCGIPFDIVFLLDSSGSVSTSDFQKIKNFVNAVVGKLTVSATGTHVAAIRFTSTAGVLFYLTEHLTTAGVQSAVSALSTATGGGTYFNPALLRARDDVLTAAKGARPAGDAVKIVVLITDGYTMNPAQSVSTAQSMRDAGIRVMAVAVGSYVHYNNLQATVLTPNNLFNVTDFNGLGESLADAIVSESCTTDECLKYPCFNGGTCTSRPIGQFMCQCPSGYTGPHCQHGGN